MKFEWLFSFAAALALLLLLPGCATPFVQPVGTQQSDILLLQTHAVMDDGYRLPYRLWGSPYDPQAIVLAVHGLNDYSHGFDSLGRYLAQAGITTFAYDARGFGNTRDAGLWHGGERLIADLYVFAGLLRSRYPDVPLFLVGESMGGAVVLGASAKLPNLAGIVLVAPAVWSRRSMPFYQRAALWLAAHTVPARRLTGEGLDIMATDNIELLRAMGADPLVIKATRVDVLYGVSNLMDAAVASSAAGIPSATLILYGLRDQIIPRTAACDWLRQLPLQQPVNLQIYADGYHMLTRDLQGTRVLEDIASWIQSTAMVPVDAGPAGRNAALSGLCGEREEPGATQGAGHAGTLR